MDEGDPFTEQYRKEKKQHCKCRLCKSVSKLSVTRRLQLRDALLGKTKVNGHRIPYRTIAKVLNEDWKVETSVTVVGQHVTGTNLSKQCRENVAKAWGADDE